ncbi:MAG: M28 family peptidase, partial [Deltaproteobacteria bacterium]|nr:M28 family peptidase [Deltaproteobacteria bacterium]
MTNLGERSSAASRSLARTWISEQMTQLGLDVSLHEYGTGANVVGELPGRSGSFLIVSAHYDTVEGTPGANDDATGVAALLEIAGVLGGCPLEHGIRFVAFDEEETGLVGSFAYASRLVAENELDSVVGVLQIDTIGSDSNGDGVFGVSECDLATNETLVEAIVAASTDLAPRLQPLEGCLEVFGSDHVPFEQQGLPAVLISEPAFISQPEFFDLTQCY